MINWLLNFLRPDNDTGTVDVIHRVNLNSWVSGWTVPFIIIIIVVLVYLLYKREKRITSGKRFLLVSLRVLAYICLFVVFIRPNLDVDAEGTKPGPVPVIIDASQSMVIKDVGGNSRASAAADLAKELVELQPQYADLEFKLFRAGELFEEYSPDKDLVCDGSSTSLNRMLDRGLKDYLGSYCPGVLFLSDGAHNTNEPYEHALLRLKKNNIPMYSIGFGELQSKDVAIRNILAENVIFKDEKAKIYINLNQRGYDNQNVVIKLYLDNSLILEKKHKLDDKLDMSVDMEYIPEEVGEFQLRAEVAKLDGEVTVDNNEFVKTVKVIDEQIKILMIFGTPTWEYRYLHGAFERDNRIKTKVYLESLDSRYKRTEGIEEKFTFKLPDSLNQLDEEYDLIVISAINAMLLPQKFRSALNEFVKENAGGVVFISDRNYIPQTTKNTELEEMLPLTISSAGPGTYRDELFSKKDEELKFQISEEGFSSPLVAFAGTREENQEIWDNLPSHFYCYREGRLKPAAINLLVSFKNQHQQKYPAIVHHSYGKGGVLFMGFDSTWRWRKEYGDRYFQEFWGKVVQFMGLPHLLNESAQSVINISRENCFTGERISVTAKISNADYTPYLKNNVTLYQKQDDETVEIEMLPIPQRLGMYRANFWPEKPGKVSFNLDGNLGAKEVNLRVVRQRREFIDSGMNEELLTKSETITSGKFYKQGAKPLAAILDEIKANRPTLTQDFRVSLWDNWILLLLCMLFFTAEWIVRKTSYLD